MILISPNGVPVEVSDELGEWLIESGVGYTSPAPAVEPPGSDGSSTPTVRKTRKRTTTT